MKRRITARALGRFGAWLLAAVSVLLTLLYFLNLPFYSGSSVGSHFAWRMEHGRFRFSFDSWGSYHEDFYIDINSEGLKFAPEWQVWAWNDWFFNVPLWVPLLVCISASVWMFRASRWKETGCPKCGYDLKGLAEGSRCPECGRKGASQALTE